MHIAFTIFKFFPHGGSARDLAKIAARCLERAHRVRIYALEWEGPRLQGVETVVMPTRGLRSHVRQRRFADRVAAHAAAHPVDLVVGMNKMPGLDVYYAADSCFEDKARIQRPWIYRLTTRYRHYAEFERRVFAPDSRTRILTIAPGQDAAFRDVYRTPAYRFIRCRLESSGTGAGPVLKPAALSEPNSTWPKRTSWYCSWARASSRRDSTGSYAAWLPCRPRSGTGCVLSWSATTRQGDSSGWHVACGSTPAFGSSAVGMTWRRGSGRRTRWPCRPTTRPPGW